MQPSERILIVLLRLGGVMLLTALIPAAMPFAWMKDIHHAMGMGELPEGPIMGYLTRSLSAMYAMHGALVYWVSLDVRKYLAMVKFLAAWCVVFGAGMIVLDIAVDMPLWWTVGEGPFIILFGGILFGLARRVQHATPVPA